MLRLFLFLNKMSYYNSSVYMHKKTSCVFPMLIFSWLKDTTTTNLRLNSENYANHSVSCRRSISSGPG